MSPFTIEHGKLEDGGAIGLVEGPTLTLHVVGTASEVSRMEVLEATREDSITEFKEKFHCSPLSRDASGAWCELIKDMVAMANSDGGFILLGVRNDGSASGADITACASVDPAIITDKIFSYTGVHFDGFRLSTAYKDGKLIAILEIRKAETPIMFIDPGNYLTSSGKQKSAFVVGAIYVRHGAKSEPCTPTDFYRMLDEGVSKKLDKMNIKIVSPM